MRALRRVVRYVVLGLVAGVVVAFLIRRARVAATPPRAPHAPVWPPFEHATAASPAPDAADEPGPATDPEVLTHHGLPADPSGRQTWVAPIDGRCPDGYPVKANDRSHIYHVPGGRSYERTVPERCYPDPESAAADGYRAAKA